MYLQWIIPVVMALFIVFNKCANTLVLLRLTQVKALCLIALAVVLDLVISPTGGKVVIGWGGMVFLAVALVWLLFDADTKFFRVLLMTALFSILYFTLKKFGEEIPYDLSDLFLTILIGLGVYSLADNLKEALCIAIFSVNFGEIMFHFIERGADKFYFGTETYLSNMFIVVFVVLLTGGFVMKSLRNKRQSNALQSDFEASITYDER